MKISLRQAATPQRRLRPRVTIGPPRSSSGQHARRRFLGLAAGFAALPISRIARAQSYPARPVRIIVGFLPGDSTDVAARLISQRLSERLRQQFFVENRAGAAGNIATEAAAPPLMAIRCSRLHLRTRSTRRSMNTSISTLFATRCRLLES